MPKKKKPRNRAAQDATLINIRALWKAYRNLAERIIKLEKRRKGGLGVR